MNKSISTPPKWLYRYTFVTIATLWVSFYFFNIIKLFSDLILIILVSLLVSAILEQPVTKLSLKGMRRGLATFLVIIISLVIIVVAFIYGSSIFISQYSELKNSIPEIIKDGIALVSTMGFELNYVEINKVIDDFFAQFLRDNAKSIFLSLSKYLVNFFIALFLIFYLVADGPKIRRTICSLLPQNRQESFLSIWEESTKKAGGFFLVRFLLALYATVISYIFFLFIGLPYALPLALWTGITSQLIPVIGAYLAAILPLMISLSYTSEKTFYILLFIIIYQQIENYLLSPRLSKNILHVHPAIAFFSTILGATLGGFFGAIIAVPIVATAQAFLSSYLERYPLIDSTHLDEVKPKPKLITRKIANKKDKIKNKIKNSNKE
jgi:predicted PurR-regulated permease PerM